MDDDAVTLVAADGSDISDQTVIDAIANLGGTVVLYNEDLEDMNDGLKTKAIPRSSAIPTTVPEQSSASSSTTR